MRVGYTNLRSNLFVRSYCGLTIKERLIKKYPDQRRLLLEISKVARVLRLNSKILRPVVLKDKNPGKLLSSKIVYPEDKKMINIYLEIEYEIWDLTLAKQDKDNLISEDYE